MAACEGFGGQSFAFSALHRTSNTFGYQLCTCEPCVYGMESRCQHGTEACVYVCQSFRQRVEGRPRCCEAVEPVAWLETSPDSIIPAAPASLDVDPKADPGLLKYACVTWACCDLGSSATNAQILQLCGTPVPDRVCGGEHVRRIHCRRRSLDGSDLGRLIGTTVDRLCAERYLGRRRA